MMGSLVGTNIYYIFRQVHGVLHHFGLEIRQVSASLAFHINPHDLVRENDSFSPIKPAMPNDITGFSQMVF